MSHVACCSLVDLTSSTCSSSLRHPTRLPAPSTCDLITELCTYDHRDGVSLLFKFSQQYFTFGWCLCKCITILPFLTNLHAGPSQLSSDVDTVAATTERRLILQSWWWWRMVVEWWKWSGSILRYGRKVAVRSMMHRRMWRRRRMHVRGRKRRRNKV